MTETTRAAVPQSLLALQANIQCDLALGRALLKGLAASSLQARHAVDAALQDELADLDLGCGDAAEAAHHVVAEVHADLFPGVRGLQDRIVQAAARTAP